MAKILNNKLNTYTIYSGNIEGNTNYAKLAFSLLFGRK